MLVKSIKRAGLFFPAKNISIGDLQLELGLSDAEVIKAVSSSENLRLKNLAAAISSGPKIDMVVVNQFLKTQTGANVLLLTVSYNLMVFNKNVHEAMIEVATVLNRNLETRKPRGLHTEEYTVRPIDSEYWRGLYMANNSLRT